MCLLLVPQIAAGSEPRADTPTTRRLEELYSQSSFPGFAVAVTSPDRTVYAAGFGWADRDGRIPFTEQTILNIGSVSKTFIGVALLQAVERDQVDLDADIDTYLPFSVRNPRFPDLPITLRQLATHTSGIEDREAIYEKAYTRGKKASMELGEYLRRYLDPDGEWFSKKGFGKEPPGKRYTYSNIGAALAAHVLEQVTGSRFDELTRKNILQPLGMADSGWSYAAIDEERHATLYEDGKALDPYTLVTYPDGGLRTSVASLARYLSAITGDGRLGNARILQPESVRALLASQFAEGEVPKGLGKSQTSSGIFWAHNRSGNIGHNGGDPGITTFLSFDPDTRRGRIFFTNTMIDSQDKLADFQAIWKTLEEAP